MDKWRAWPVNRIIPLELEKPLPVVKIDDTPEELQEQDQTHEDVDDNPNHEEVDEDPEEELPEDQQPHEDDEPP